MNNAYLLKEKVKNKEYEIKQAIWEVLGELSEVCKRTKYEVYIQIPFDVSWSLFKVLLVIPIRNFKTNSCSKRISTNIYKHISELSQIR